MKNREIGQVLTPQSTTSGSSRRSQTRLTTSARLADGIGWSRTAVANYAALKAIDSAAWEIVTTYQKMVTSDEDEEVTTNVTTVTPFTERLLREILDLQPTQQLELCRKLAKGKDGKGHKFGKKEFKADAEWFRALNVLNDLAAGQGGSKTLPPSLPTAAPSIALDQAPKRPFALPQGEQDTARFGLHDHVGGTEQYPSVRTAGDEVKGCFDGHEAFQPIIARCFRRKQGQQSLEFCGVNHGSGGSGDGSGSGSGGGAGGRHDRMSKK